MRKKNIIISGVILLGLFFYQSGCSKNTPSENENMPSESVSASNESITDAQSALSDSTSVQSVTPPTDDTADNPLQVPIVINEMSDGKEGTFYLGQSSSEVRNILIGMDIHIKFDSDITIDTEGFGFEFDDQDRLISIGLVTASNTPTLSGLNFGDTYEKMIEIYGLDYSEKVISADASSYEYKIGSHYFSVRIYNGGVNLWEISSLNMEQLLKG